MMASLSVIDAIDTDEKKSLYDPLSISDSLTGLICTFAGYGFLLDIAILRRIFSASANLFFERSQRTDSGTILKYSTIKWLL